MSKKRLFTLLVTAGFLSLSAKAAFADSADSSGNSNASVANTEQMLNQMTQQTAALEAQMNQLKKQIRELKTEQNQLQQQHAQPVAQPAPGNHPAITAIATNESTYVAPGTAAQAAGSPKAILNPAVTYITGTPVVIGPYIGEQSSFNASDLVINYSEYNEDLRLLQLRQGIDQQYCQAGLPIPVSPMLMLSGEIVGTGDYQQPRGPSNSRFDLPGAELDVIPTIGEWISGLIALRYDNSQLPNTALTNNSRFFLDQGFFTIGNLNRFPMYLSVGQLYVPFGTYSTNMITDPLTQDAFQTRARVFELGYATASGQGLYGAAYAFNGDADTSHANNINDVGGNIGITYSNGSKWSIDTGLGAIADVADSLGMQNNGLAVNPTMPTFTGFSNTTSPTTPTADQIERQVPGVAPHLNFTIGNFGVNSEYVAATSSFNTMDMTFNGSGARPQALNVEGYYTFKVLDRPSALTLGYGESWQALALNIPEYRYIAAVTTSIWRDTVEELEYRHDTNYGYHDTASGAGLFIPASAFGGCSNTVTLQLGIYF